MPRVVRGTTIHAPPAAVFALLADPGALARILPGVKERRMPTPGPLGVGSRIVETRDAQGRPLESELTVTEHVPGLRRLMAPVVKPMLATQVAGDLAAVKARLEGPR